MNQRPDLTLTDFSSLRYSAGGLPPTRLVSQRAGALLAWAGLQLGLSPSAITLLGLATFLAATFLYATMPAGLGPALLCVILFQLGYALDCADGQLARASGRTSAFGAWLDLACDHVRNIALAYAALLWLVRSGWSLEIALMASGLLLVGMIVYLHTITVSRQSGGAPRPPSPGLAGQARSAAAFALDTPTVLLCLGLMRMTPALLPAYAVFIAVCYGWMSAAVVRAHLSGQS